MDLTEFRKTIPKETTLADIKAGDVFFESEYHTVGMRLEALCTGYEDAGDDWGNECCYILELDRGYISRMPLSTKVKLLKAELRLETD